MKTRLAGVALASAVLAFNGCSSTPQNKKIALQIEPNQAESSPATQPAIAQNDAPSQDPLLIPTPSQPVSAGLLARKTESYAKSMESAMARRNAVRPTSQDDSISGLIDPTEFRIGPTEEGRVPTTAPIAQKGAPEVKPAIQASMAQANSGAAVEVVKTTEASNTPIALPPPPEQNADKASAVLTPATDSFESRITKHAKDYPRDLSANLDYQLLLFLRDEPVPQLSAVTGLPSEDRELISAVMDGLSNFKNTLRSDNNMLLSRKIKPLTDLADRLKTQAELSIPTLTLCTKVEGFGRYDPIDPSRFPAQRETQAIIYCELENFSSQQNQAKIWQTDVTQEAVLYTEDGMQVWADKTQQVQDLARNRRHDFYLRTLVTFPSTLTVGRYLLKVSIVDRQANRVAEASLPIQVVAQ
ncbi:MAG TPA: hypothetical protein VHS31_13080 [Tepidisphaeraceae bacterium]|jgi:hypothetical protein|nr:hypothetical protein [Tepidisphaeraceae bacterium]